MDVKCWTYGKSLEDVCPSDLRNEYGALKKEYFAILKSFTAARIDTHKIRLVDQFPIRFKSEWEDINSQIMDYVVEQYPKPSRYDELVAIQECLSVMENRPLCVRREKLSDREFEILKMIARGLTTKAIAAEVKISPKTISTYRSRILAKLDLHNNSDIIHYVIDYNLTD